MAYVASRLSKRAYHLFYRRIHARYGVKCGVLLLLFLFNCVEYIKYIPDPEKDIGKWLKNFEHQRSFSYHYKLQTKSVYSEAKGDCVVGWGEHIKGVWHYADSKLTFEYVGLGDVEYAKKNRKWEQTSRGEESDILVQIKRLLKFNKFEYMGPLNGYLYQFKANIPFLAPGQWKELTGFLRISARNFLPELVWAGLPDSSVYWEAKIYNYNKVKSIESPVRNWNYYLVSSDSTFDIANLSKTLRRRLDVIDVDYQSKKTADGIVLTLPQEYSIEDIKTMLAPGMVNVYGLTMNKQNATKVAYLKDDINNPLFLTRKLLDQDDIKSAQVRFDALSRPYILISLNKKISVPTEIAFEMDSIVLGTATLDMSKKIDKIKLYIDMGYYELDILKAALVQPLPVINLKLIAMEKN